MEQADKTIGSATTGGVTGGLDLKAATTEATATQLASIAECGEGKAEGKVTIYGPRWQALHTDNFTFQSAEEKATLCALLHKKAREVGAVAVMTVTESWMVEAPIDDLDKVTFPLAENLQRKSCVVTAFKGPHINTCAMITPFTTTPYATLDSDDDDDHDGDDDDDDGAEGCKVEAGESKWVEGSLEVNLIKDWW